MYKSSNCSHQVIIYLKFGNTSTKIKELDKFINIPGTACTKH